MALAQGAESDSWDSEAKLAFAAIPARFSKIFVARSENFDMEICGARYAKISLAELS